MDKYGELLSVASCYVRSLKVLIDLYKEILRNLVLRYGCIVPVKIGDMKCILFFFFFCKLFVCYILTASLGSVPVVGEVIVLNFQIELKSNLKLDVSY